MEEPTVLEHALGVHEIFDSYMRAGFTRAEALKLVMNDINNAAGRKTSE